LQICYIDRVIVAVTNLAAARDSWQSAGFSLSSTSEAGDSISFAAGALEIELCTASSDGTGPLADGIREAASRGGGIVGWVWGARDVDRRGTRVALADAAEAHVPERVLNGVFHAAREADGDFDFRRSRLRERCGVNSNTVDYLDHIVVMAPALEEAIAAYESLGVPCKRVREAGRGIRQAFFKLEQTVIEVAGPARGRPGCWGLAFMCADICKAIADARARGLQATEPKRAVQGGQIARLVEPLDGVSVAFMQAPAS